jgi:hypothetical protein
MKRLVVALCLLSLVAGARPNRRLESAGVVLLAIGYLAALSLAIHYQQPELALPILGPLIDLRRCDRCTGSPTQDAVISGLVLDAALQAAGAALLSSGLSIHRKRQPPLVFRAPLEVRF